MNAAEFFTALQNTLIIGLGVLFVALPISTFLAIALCRTQVFARNWAWLAILSQLVVPLYAFAGSWCAGFGTLGWWPLAPALSIGHDWGARVAVVFLHAVAAIPWCVLILSLGLRWSHRSTEELAWLEGGWGNLVRHVLLPTLLPWMALAGLWSLVPIFTEMVITNLYRVSTLSEQIYLDISLDTMTSATIIVSILGSMVPVTFSALAIYRSLPVTALASEPPKHHASWPFPLGNYSWPVNLFTWAITAALTVVPLFNLFYKAGWQVIPGQDGQVGHRWTWQRLGLTIQETATQFTQELYWSMLLAVSTTALALSMAILLRLVLRTPRQRAVIHLLCLVFISTPGPVVGLWMTQLFLRSQVPGLSWLYDHTLSAAILAQQFRIFPLAWLLTLAIASSIPKSSWQLAQQDNLSSFDRLRIIILPQTWALWFATVLILVSASIGELSTHLLVLPPGVTTVAQRLFELLHFGMRYEDSGLCLLLVCIGWGVAIAAWRSGLVSMQTPNHEG